MPRTADLRLYLVTDRALGRGRPLLDLVRQAVAGGVTVVQLREKQASTSRFVTLAEELQELLVPMGVPLVINDRVDVALAAAAAGVHLGQADMEVTTARRLLGKGRLLGVSVSTVEEARRAEAGGADYLGVSPIYATPTKTDAPSAVGLPGLAAIRAATRLPLVAIGGLHADNLSPVIESGADGIAVVSAIMAADDPGAAARELRACIDRGRTLGLAGGAADKMG
jgi:thiamine-phosphate pyrophosphorylase